MMKLVMSMVVLLCVGAAQDLLSPTLDIISELQKIKTMEEKLNALYDEVRELRSKNEESLLSSMSDLKSSVSDLTTSVSSLSSQLSITIHTEVKRLMNSLSLAVSVLNDAVNKQDKKQAKTERLLDSLKSSYRLINRTNSVTSAFLNHHTIPTFYWVGLTDQTTGQWRWVDDTPYTMNKERWNPEQPDDWKQHGLGEEGEDCAAITHTGKLNDSHCSNKVGFICRVQF